MRRAIFSISVCNPLGQHKRFTVTICGARPTAVKPGRSSRPTEARAATRHGSRLIRLTGRATASNTRHTIALIALQRRGISTLHKRRDTWQSPVNIPNAPIYGTLDVDTNGNVFVGGWTGGTGFRCVRSSNAQIAGQTPSFDRNTAVNLGGGLLYPGAD